MRRENHSFGSDAPLDSLVKTRLICDLFNLACVPLVNRKLAGIEPVRATRDESCGRSSSAIVIILSYGNFLPSDFRFRRPGRLDREDEEDHKSIEARHDFQGQHHHFGLALHAL